MSFDRRTFLGASAATLGAAYLGACGGGEDAPPVAAPEPEPNDGAELVAFAPAALAVDDARYPLGVMASATGPSSALLWAKIEGEPGRARVWRDHSATEVKLVADLEVSPRDGFAKVPVSGLGPGFYRYAFFDDALGARSPIGRFRTNFGDGDLRPLTLGPMACTNFERAPWTALPHLAAMEPDVLCHLGDLGYNDGAVTLEEYRASYARVLTDPGYRAILPTAGIYATWDDHEVTNDFDPELMAREAPEHLAAATDAYFETLPIPEDAPRRLWRSHRYGATAELFVLDCRGERRPSTRQTDGVYVSEAQLDWLLAALEASPCHFKVLMSSVPITKLFGLWNFALGDRWEGYGAQRERLLDHLTSRVSGRVLFLAGDFHCGYVARVEAEGPRSNLFEVCTSSGARAPNPLAILYDTGDLAPADVFPPAQFLFGTGSPQHATAVTLDPLRDEVRVRVVDARPDRDGERLFDGVIPYI